MFGSHLFTLMVFSALVSAFFATLSRETPREAFRFGSIMLGLMVGISLIVAYVMYVFPLG